MCNYYLSKNFICSTKEYATRDNFVNAPYFRRTFSIETIKESQIYICGLGFYQLFINGVNITKGILAPYISNPNDLLYYDKYNVTEYLRTGENCIGVLLGNGFLNSIGGEVWDFDKAEFRSSPKLAMTFVVDNEILFEADDNFKTSPSPILFDDIRIGEHYDANLNQPGWNTCDFDDSSWRNAIGANTPLGKPTICTVEPIKLQKEIKPQKIIPIEGGFLYDFGLNTSGVCRLKISGDKGQKIIMRHGEVLLEDKTLYLKNLVCNIDEANDWQKDVYYPCGQGVEIYQPTFTYHGFRYVFVEGIYPEQATEELLTFLVYNSDLASISYFKCDNNIINSLQELTLNSDLSNFYYYPTDCPQREKNGWTADIAISAEQMLYNFDCVNSMREWLTNVRFAQKDNGAIPGIVPTSGWGFAWGNGPAWDSVLIELPYMLYKFSGNIEILKENRDAIALYIKYLASKIDNRGLVAFGLPDWCECGLKYEGETFTPLDISDTLVSIDICNKAYTIFSILDDEYANVVYNLRNDLIQSFRKEHLTNDLYVDCKTQTAQAKAIDVGVFNDAEKTKAVDNLIKIIKDNGDKFKVGVIGARVLFRVLCEYSYHDLAIKLITQDTFPSYKNWLDKGYTALGEKFYETYPNSILRKDGWRVMSFNHHFWGDISYIFFRYIVGLNINPNLNNENEIEIKPSKFSDINNIECKYSRNGNMLHLLINKVNGNLRVDVKKNTGFKIKVLL